MGVPLGRRGHLHLRPVEDARARCTRSTRRRPRSAARSTSVTCSRTRTPTPSPASSACAGREVFYPMGWDDNGVPTERRVQNYFGVRCDPSLPYDADVRPAGEAGQAGDPDQPAELRRAVRPARGRGRAEVRGALAHARPVGRLGDDLHHHRRAGAPGVAARVPADARPRRGLPVGGADALGRRLPHGGVAGGARRPRAAGRVPRGALRAAPTATPTS